MSSNRTLSLQTKYTNIRKDRINNNLRTVDKQIIPILGSNTRSIGSIFYNKIEKKYLGFDGTNFVNLSGTINTLTETQTITEVNQKYIINGQTSSTITLPSTSVENDTLNFTNLGPLSATITDGYYSYILTTTRSSLDLVYKNGVWLFVDGNDLTFNYDLLGSFLSPNETAGGDFYNTSINSDGTRIVVGANIETIGATPLCGRAYIFQYINKVWSLETTLVPPTPTVGGFFGFSVDINADGTKVVIGAVAENGGASSSGRVHVYVYSSGTWSLEETLVSDNPETSGRFGQSVKINADGTKIIVGAQDEDGGATDSGRAYVFSYNGTVWSLSETLTSPNFELNGKFGTTVSINSDGNVVAVGAQDETVSALSGAGRVYIKDLVNSVTTTLVSPNGVGTGSFGNSISLNASGETIVIGARGENVEAGRAYVFSLTEQNWSLKSTLLSNSVLAGNFFGQSVAINANATSIVVGETHIDDGAVSEAGKVHLFSYDGNYWNLKKTLSSPNAVAQGFFGGSVSISSNGAYVAIGAEGEDGVSLNDTGRVYIY